MSANVAIQLEIINDQAAITPAATSIEYLDSAFTLLDVPSGTFLVGGSTIGGEGPFLDGNFGPDNQLGPSYFVFEQPIFNVYLRQTLDADSICTPCPIPPPNTDPPLPPIWPYPVGNVYQREHWSMDIRMIRLDTKVIEFLAFNGDGTVMDLTGCAVRFTVKWDYFDADANAVIKLDNTALTGVTVDSPAALGTGRVTIPKTATASLPVHRSDLVYDIKVKKPDTSEHTVARGAFIVLPNATETI